MENIIKEQLVESSNVIKSNIEQIDKIQKIIKILIKTFKNGNKILICGNGGSAADAQHIAAEFIVRLRKNRESLPCIAINTDTSIITAISNDWDYRKIFSRQIESLGRKGDSIILLSTSGNSPNIIEAAKISKKNKLTIISFSGKGGGCITKYSDISLVINSQYSERIQESYLTILHIIAFVIENEFQKK